MTKKLKILNLVLGYPPARFIGAEIYDHLINKALIERGHIVHVRTKEIDTGKSWQYEGIEVNIDNNEGTPYDIIVSHLDLAQHAFYYARLNSHPPKNKHEKPAKAKLVGIAHNEQVETIRSAGAVFWNLIVSNSEALALDLSRNKNRHAELVVAIPPTRFSNESRTMTIKTKDKIDVLQVGIQREKGGVEVINNLAESNPKWRVAVLVSGWGFNDLEKLDKNVEVIQHSEINSDFWQGVKTLILPSVIESWSMTASEALANNVSIVSYSDLKGVVENIGEAGIYLPRTATTAEWKKAILESRKIKNNIREEQAENNRTRYDAGLENLVAKIEALLN